MTINVITIVFKFIPPTPVRGYKKESVELQYLIFEKSNKDENEKKS